MDTDDGITISGDANGREPVCVAGPDPDRADRAARQDGGADRPAGRTGPLSLPGPAADALLDGRLVECRVRPQTAPVRESITPASAGLRVRPPALRRPAQRHGLAPGSPPPGQTARAGSGPASPADPPGTVARQPGPAASTSQPLAPGPVPGPGPRPPTLAEGGRAAQSPEQAGSALARRERTIYQPAPVIPPGAIPANDFPGGFDPGRLLDTLSEVVFRTDAEGRWTYLNPAWTRLTGFDVATSLGTRFIDYVHPDEVEHTIALFMAVVVGGADHCHHETRYRTSDGSYRRVQIRAQVLRDDAGEVVGNVGTIVDVTAARFGAESAGELGALLELVPSGGRLDDLPVGVLVYDSDLVLVRPSRVVERLVGVRVEAGQHLDELADRLRPGIAGGQRLGGEWGLVATAQRTGQAQIGDLDVWRAPAHDASARHALAGALVEGQAQAGGTAEAAGPVRTLRATVIPPSPGGDGQLAIVLSDITDLRRAERQQAALAYLGQRALSTLDVPALLTEAVELVASTLGVERCDLGECIQITTGGGRARRVVFDPAHASTAAAVGGSAPSPSPAPPAGEGGGATRPVGWAEPAQPTADAGGDGGHGHGDVRQPVGVYAHIRASVGRRASHVTSGPVSTQPGSLVWRVLTAGEPVVIEDLAARADITREDWLQGDGAVSTVAVPIIANGRAWGILAAHSTSRRRFTRDEAYFVHSVAHVLSAAVERAETQEDRARLAVFEDRDRIACELHDLVIQRLFSVGLRLQSLIRMVPEPGAVRMSAAIADLDETIDEIRRTIFDLRPPYTY